MAAYRRVYDMRVSLWAWWEVVAAHHRVHDYACCHLQADCLESGGISSGPLHSIYTSMGIFTFTYTAKYNTQSLAIMTNAITVSHRSVKLKFCHHSNQKLCTWSYFVPIRFVGVCTITGNINNKWWKVLVTCFDCIITDINKNRLKYRYWQTNAETMARNGQALNMIMNAVSILIPFQFCNFCYLTKLTNIWNKRLNNNAA